MSLLLMFSLAELPALSHLIMRILVLLLVEGECARLVQQPTGKPVVLINFSIIGIYAFCRRGGRELSSLKPPRATRLWSWEVTPAFFTGGKMATS